jgi:hypothetical protein
MYPVDVDNTTGRPIDAAAWAARDRNERLIEIKQGKGQSETHPLLSPNDEFAGYEMFQAILGLPANVGREGSKLITYVSQDPYAVTFYKLGDTNYGARSNEFGYANYEIIPPPQIAVNPLTEVSDQFSIELGLTEQQKQEILPILKDEIHRLGALKKDTSLSGPKKLEELRSIGVSFDEKIKPLLNADQQSKFQEMREALRRRTFVKIAEEVGAKLEDTAEQRAEKMKQDLETIRQKVEGAWFGR